MKEWPSDPKKLQAKLREIGFAQTGKTKRSLVFERAGVKVNLPRMFKAHRAVDNWVHTNREKLEGGNGQRG